MENNISSSSRDLYWTASAHKVSLVQPSSAASRVTAANSLQEAVVIHYNSMPVEHELFYYIFKQYTVHQFTQFYIKSVSYIVDIMQKCGVIVKKEHKRNDYEHNKGFFEEIQNNIMNQF